VEFTIDGVTYKLEPIIWSGLIGALVAFFGSVLSNRHSRRQLRMQHEHDKRQAAAERQMTLKREVFMEAAQWLAGVRRTLGQYPDVSIEKPGPGGDHAAAPTRMQIVSDAPVRLLTQRVLMETVKFIAKYGLARQALVAGDKEINRLVNELGRFDKGEITQEKFDDLLEQHESLRLDLLPKLEKFKRDILADMEAYTVIEAELEIAMASELGFKTDPAAQMAAAREHNRASREIVEDLLMRSMDRLKPKRDDQPPS
jgi:hypothetical protein